MQHSRSKLPSIRNFENTRPTGSSEWSKSPPPSLNQTVPLQAYKPSPPLGLYAISKTALIGLTKLLAAELGQNLRDPTIGATLDEHVGAMGGLLFTVHECCLPFAAAYVQITFMLAFRLWQGRRESSCLRSFVAGPFGIRVNCLAPGLVRTHFSEFLWKDDGSGTRASPPEPT